MENYQKSGLRSSGVQHSDEKGTSPALPGGCHPPLVNTLISQTAPRSCPVESLQIWPRAVKIVRPFTGKPPIGPPPVRGEITGFSAASRQRLRFTAMNAFPELISQFGMTYHNHLPDGRTVKKQLNAFLTLLRKKYPSVGYLWLLEFQSRGAAHVHLFLTLPRDLEGLQHFMAKAWNRIAEPEDQDHLNVHKHPKNFIPWVMENAGYLCKYLDKEAQKAVPVGFTGVGRFWGNSRGLVPDAIEVQMSDIDKAFSYEATDYQTGEVEEFRASVYVTRQLCRHHEKSLRRSRWKSSARTRPTSYTFQNASRVYITLERWLSKQKLPFDKVPF